MAVPAPPRALSRRWLTVYLAFSALLYVAAPLINSNFCYLLAALYLLAMLLLWKPGRLRPQVRATVPRRMTAGAEVPVSVCLRQRGWLPRLVLVVELDMPDGVALVPAAWQVPALPPRGSRTVSGTLNAARRGAYLLGGARVTHYGYGGFFGDTVRTGEEQELLVHPRPVRGLDCAALLAGRLTATGQRHVPARAGEEFHALRPYQRGDSLRRIHWRTTARTGELTVVATETPALEAPELYLDTAVPAGDAFEFNARVAATLVAHLVATTGCSLRAGTRHVAAGGGAASATAMLDALARVQAREPAPPPRAVSIIVTLPGSALAGSPPAGAIVLVNDLWETGDAAADALPLSRYGAERDA